MKLITLNTNSAEGETCQKQLNDFVETIIKEKPDVIALQEVNQTKSSGALQIGELDGMVLMQKDIPVKKDNYAANAARLLEINGLRYNWVWIPVKTDDKNYDEGCALLSRMPIEKTDIIVPYDKNNAAGDMRKIPGIKTNGAWFYSVCIGENEKELLKKQLDKINGNTSDDVWLMGDFHCRADVRNEGYDLVCERGWYDTYELAKTKDTGFTVEAKSENICEKMRIDYIWKNKPENIVLSKVIFNGEEEPVISDHYGVMVETDN